MRRNQTTQNPSPDAELCAMAALIEEFWCLLHSQTLGSTSHALTLLYDLGLTLPQLMTLHLLGHMHVRTVSGIADLAHLSRPAASQLVDRLVTQGLVDRIEDPEDRRQKQVSLSPTGRALFDQINRSKTETMAMGMEPLSTGTRQLLAKALSEARRELSAVAAHQCMQE